jgi:hypothetical protein
LTEVKDKIATQQLVFRRPTNDYHRYCWLY